MTGPETTIVHLHVKNFPVLSMDSYFAFFIYPLRLATSHTDIYAFVGRFCTAFTFSYLNANANREKNSPLLSNNTQDDCPE